METDFWSRVQMPFGVKDSRDIIFSAILVGGIDREKANDLYKTKVIRSRFCLNKFRGQFPYCVFNNEYAVFYELIMNKHTSVFTASQIVDIVAYNRDLILDSPYINTSDFVFSSVGTMATDDDILQAFAASLRDKLVTLSMIEVTEEEFNSSCEIYKNWYLLQYAGYMASNMAAIVSDMGYEERKIGRRKVTYRGVEAMHRYYRESKKVMDSLSNSELGTSVLIDKKWLEEELTSESKPDDKRLMQTGIREIDRAIQWLRRGYMLGILGPTKGGKTRFTAHLVYKALSQGLNVAVWALEGNQDEWMSMLTVCCIAYASYEAKKQGREKEVVRLSSNDVLNKNYVNVPSMRARVVAAKQLIATSENFGRLSFIKGTAYSEDFLDVIQQHYENENAFDVIVIDSLVNIQSKTPGSKSERISDAYMAFKDYLANKMRVPALGIVPAQLKQESIDEIRRNPDADIAVTAGGESAETIRTPDETIGLFSTKEERANDIMKIYSVASRHSGDFENFQCKCYLGSCMFLSEEDI